MSIWALFQAFWIPLALWAFRSGSSFYRQTRATYASNRKNIRTCPPTVQRALNILFFSVLLFFLYTSRPAPNIFKETKSRLQTPPDVLFTRLRSKRPLSSLDEALQEKLKSKDSKLLYIAYGPHVLTNCAFCVPGEPTTYLIYALSAILAPHLFHTAILGFATSGLLVGPEGARWRPHAILVVLALAAGETYLTAIYDVAANVKAVRGSEIDFFYDKMRLYRAFAFIAVDCMLAGVLWLSSTGRLFVRSPTVAERLQNILQNVETGTGRLWAAGAVMNSVSRDEKLRGRWLRYWETEGEVQEDPEVLEAERRALNRTDVRSLGLTAGKRAEDVEKILGGVLGHMPG